MDFSFHDTAFQLWWDLDDINILLDIIKPLMCSNTEPSKIINFPFGTNGKLMVLGASMLKHIMVAYALLTSLEKNHLINNNINCVKNGLIFNSERD